MKKPFVDSLFFRLFLLLFFVFSFSFFAGREVLNHLGLQPSFYAPVPNNPFKPSVFILRLIAAGVTAWVAARWLSNPIKRMAQAAAALGKNLDSAPINETSGPFEVRQASKVFNQMQMRVKQQIEERNLFLASVSHDLRTPLTRLRLRTEKIELPNLKSDFQNDINEMASIVESTLNYLRDAKYSEATCLLDISALVHSLAEDAIERGCNVMVSGQAQPIKLQPQAIRRCLNNLLENAIRYGDKAIITLNDSSASELIVSINDAGPGIAEDKLEAVFIPFYRLDNSRNRNTGGVGLGLAIARDMARKQGGDVVLRNSPAGGLIATLSLPKRD